jgi:hypothetical protein
MPYATLPVDTFLKNYVSTERKTERRNLKAEGNMSAEF